MVDYLAFTTTAISTAETVRTLLGLPDTFDTGPGGHGYTASIRGVGWRIYEGSQGVYVQISGEGLATREPLDLIRRAQAADMRTVRVDVAVDMPEDLMPAVVEAVRHGAFVGGFKRAQVIEGYGVGAGTTAYLGGRTSECFFRAYDKQAEAQLEAPLTRFECEFSGSKAGLIAGLLLLGVDHRQLLAGVVRFVVLEHGDSNLARRPLAAWWERVIQGAVAVRVRKVVEEVAVSYCRVRAWLKHQCARALAVVTEAEGAEILVEIREEGLRRKSKRDDGLIESYRMASVQAWQFGPVVQPT